MVRRASTQALAEPSKASLTSTLPVFGPPPKLRRRLPARMSSLSLRYQHSRIRPVFSGCGRRVEDTLNDLRSGRAAVKDLPPIQVHHKGGTERGALCTIRSVHRSSGLQVIVGDSKDGEEPWYFSLNNRRLWVLKALRAEGGLGPANTGEPGN